MNNSILSVCLFSRYSLCYSRKTVFIGHLRSKTPRRWTGFYSVPLPQHKASKCVMSTACFFCQRQPTLKLSSESDKSSVKKISTAWWTCSKFVCCLYWRLLSIASSFKHSTGLPCFFLLPLCTVVDTYMLHLLEHLVTITTFLPPALQKTIYILLY